MISNICAGCRGNALVDSVNHGLAKIVDADLLDMLIELDIESGFGGTQIDGRPTRAALASRGGQRCGVVSGDEFIWCWIGCHVITSLSFAGQLNKTGPCRRRPESNRRCRSHRDGGR